MTRSLDSLVRPNTLRSVRGGATVADPPITFTAITPASDATGGGSVATLTGTNFIGPAGVSFGANSSSTIAVVNSSTISCTIPASASAGAVTVTLTQGSKSTSRSNWTYFGVPTLTSVTPISGATSGNIIATLTGTQFVASLSTASFGGTNATGIVVVSPSSITCVIPSSNTTGQVSVGVATPSGMATLSSAFTYIDSDEPTFAGADVMYWQDFPRSDGTTYETLPQMTAPGTGNPDLCVLGDAGYNLASAEFRYGWYTNHAFVTTDAGHCNPDTAKWALLTGVTYPDGSGTGNAVRSILTDDPGGNQQSEPYISPFRYSRDGGFNSSEAPPSSATMVFQFWFRAGQGSNGNPGTFDTGGCKFFEMWNQGGGNRDQVGLGTNGPNTNKGNEWHVNVQGSEKAYQPLGPYFEDVSDQTWHRFTILRKAASSAGAGDGIYRAWVDGQKIIDLSSAASGVTPSGGLKAWCTQAEVDAIPSVQVGYVIWPTTANRTIYGFNYDLCLLKWWTEA